MYIYYIWEHLTYPWFFGKLTGANISYGSYIEYIHFVVLINPTQIEAFWIHSHGDRCAWGGVLQIKNKEYNYLILYIWCRFSLLQSFYINSTTYFRPTRQKTVAYTFYKDFLESSCSKSLLLDLDCELKYARRNELNFADAFCFRLSFRSPSFALSPYKNVSRLHVQLNHSTIIIKIILIWLMKRVS